MATNYSMEGFQVLFLLVDSIQIIFDQAKTIWMG